MSFWGEDELNPEQEQAILDPESVFLVACPGSGKTRTLTYKIAYELTNLSDSKEYVVAITYTNRAADEIHERVEALGVNTDKLWIGTIHSFCLEWILKPYGVYHEFLRFGFKVIDSHDKEKILAGLCGKHSTRQTRVKIWDCDFHFEPDGHVLSCKNSRKIELINRVLGEYFDILRSRRQIDFELILYFSYKLLEENVEISSILSCIFSHILVDEYQDTMKIQYSIILSILRAGAGSTKSFIVGDPNQAIYESLGGSAIDAQEFRQQSQLIMNERELSKNYRSSSRIIEFFSNFKVYNSTIISASSVDTCKSLITFNSSVDREDLEDELVRLILLNVEELGVLQKEVCVIAPWWIHLASLTRRLIFRLPSYQFNGPGTVPFARDIENFWYKLAKIALTRASPDVYVRRLRWASDIVKDLEFAGVDVSKITAKSLLRCCNTLVVTEENGLLYLSVFFERLFELLKINAMAYSMLKEHYDAFFESSRDRIARLKSEGVESIDHIDSFRRVFQSKKGITISTIHGVKGAEFDTVIAFALLEGMVPHFSDSGGQESAKKLLYVIGSRARKNLHLISERGRTRYGNSEYFPTVALRAYDFDYDDL